MHYLFKNFSFLVSTYNDSRTVNYSQCWWHSMLNWSFSLGSGREGNVEQNYWLYVVYVGSSTGYRSCVSLCVCVSVCLSVCVHVCMHVLVPIHSQAEATGLLPLPTVIFERASCSWSSSSGLWWLVSEIPGSFIPVPPPGLGLHS